MATTTIEKPQAPAVVRRSVDDASTYKLGDHDLYLFNEGTHSRLYEKLGAHLLPDGSTYFAVWAPNAKYVSVIGNFNGWDKGRHPMSMKGHSGLWEVTVPEA